MERSDIVDVELLIVDKLLGKMTLLESQEERGEAISLAIDSICSGTQKGKLQNDLKRFQDAQSRAKFIKGFLSYGIIEELLCNPQVEDIVINSLKEIYVHHAQKGLTPTGRQFESHKELELFVKKLVLFSGRGEVKKIINLELPNLEGRANIVMSPLGPQITITKAKVEPLSIIDLIKVGSLNYQIAGQLWLYLEGLSVMPANIIIAGGPGTGKTTLLNALFSFIPGNERMVVIEDTLELNTFLEDSCSRLESDEDMSLAQLVKNSLRMRPDRIVVGEVRGAEARDMITAVNVGKYCLGTIHAATAREAILRLQNEPMNVPEILVNLVDVFIILKRFHVKDRLYRAVDEVSETGGMEQKTILLSHVYKYDYEKNIIKMVSPSTIYRDRLARASGLSAKDIMNEARIRAYLLETMGNKGMDTLKEVTVFCRAYNRDPKAAVESLGLDYDNILRSLR